MIGVGVVVRRGYFRWHQRRARAALAAAAVCVSLSSGLKPPRVVVVGGGASGYFAAIAAKRHRPECGVVLVEGGRSGLRKVLVSGGGRCNVMHRDDLAVEALVENYPRGSRELRGPMTKRFGPSDTRAFFEELGVELKIESDGRVFPTTDDSNTIAEALKRAASDAGVTVKFGSSVVGVEPGFSVDIKDESPISCDAVILATGSAPAGYRIAKDLGHDLSSPYPSLFSFRLNNPHNPLKDLAGVSWYAQLSLDSFVQEGPLLVTHRGISGPCALRLSAFAAKQLKSIKYKGTLLLNSLPGRREDALLESLREYKRLKPEQSIDGTRRPFSDELPKRLWAAISSPLASKKKRWAELSDADLKLLAANLHRLPLEFDGKDTNKEEFVTAGGVALKQIDFKTMSSKKCHGLHFCGELLDVDGVTGGFNFQNCWTSGHIAGTSAAEYATLLVEEEKRV